MSWRGYICYEDDRNVLKGGGRFPEDSKAQINRKVLKKRKGFSTMAVHIYFMTVTKML